VREARFDSDLDSIRDDNDISKHGRWDRRASGPEPDAQSSSRPRVTESRKRSFAYQRSAITAEISQKQFEEGLVRKPTRAIP
jgi:hypothetical protein